jgi:acetyl-CoA acetyltransferase
MSFVEDVVIVSAVRTPIGKFKSFKARFLVEENALNRKATVPSNRANLRIALRTCELPNGSLYHRL